MNLAAGVDLLEIDRLQRAVSVYGERFLRRIFTARELAERAHRIESLAARFAAKEAVAKALGCGIGQIGWKEIEILNAPSGAPHVILHGNAERLAKEQGLTEWSVSLSHSQSHAIALVIALGE